ncbi:MAG: hypothetical protein ACK5LO_06580 [Leucobacter sp.]
MLAPALLAWAVAAAAVVHPGSGRVVAVAVAGVGCTALLLAVIARSTSGNAIALRRASVPHALRAASVCVLRYGLVACGVLLLLGTRVDTAERARGDPELAQAAERSSAVALRAVLAGFPSAQSSFGEPRAWVEAAVSGESGVVPVVLWLSGEQADESRGVGEGGEGGEGVVWAPMTPVTVHGSLVELEPGSAAVYGVRVERVEPETRQRTDGVPGLWQSLVRESARFAVELRTGLRDAAADVPGAELVPGFAVGDTSLVGEQLELRMQQSSLTHLIAVSGDLVDSGGALIV